MIEDHVDNGYSLLEVMVAIVVLTVAILPMADMFDAAIRATGTGGDYDTARSGVTTALEEARALDYEEAVSLYGPGSPESCPSAVPTGKFTCSLDARFVGEDLSPSEDSRTRMLLTVTYEWDGNTYEGEALLTADAP